MISVFCFGCFGPTESDSVARESVAFVGGTVLVRDSLDNCRIFADETRGTNRVFIFQNSELNSIRFELDTAISDFVLKDSQLVGASAMVSFKKNGPSWSYRLRSGIIEGRRDDKGNWKVKGMNLSPSQCTAEAYSFPEQDFK